MLQGNSHFYIDVLRRTTNGGNFCYIFPAKGRPLALAFKFDKDNGEVMIDKFSRDSESSFKFELSLAEELPNVNFVESS